MGEVAKRYFSLLVLHLDGHSPELPLRDNNNQCPQGMFLCKNNKNYSLITLPGVVFKVI